MKTNKSLLYIICFFCFARIADAQHFVDENHGSNHTSFGSDSINQESIPIGLHSWKIDERFGNIIPVPVDTVSFQFQNSNLTEGIMGEYNTTGNIGAPRISRLFPDIDLRMNDNQFIFSNPYDFFFKKPGDFIFTNTKSPYTNLTYNKCGNQTNGEDRITAYFAKNAGKKLGVGFKIDYLYGRGYYDQQSTAHLDGSIFTYYTADRYKLHFLFSSVRLKNTENGGIENDTYITQPENFSNTYRPADMPVRLTKAWNKMHLHSIYLTHRYNLGFTNYYDKDNNKIIVDTLLANAKPDTLTADSLSPEPIDKRALLSAYRPDFVAVTGFVHTLKINFYNREYTDNITTPHYYADWITQSDSARDNTDYCNIENTLAFEINEGFNKWAKVGTRFFAKHQFNSFTLPNAFDEEVKFVYNYVNLGAQFYKQQGKYFHFNALGEIRTTGKDWGEFNAEATADFSLPLRKDTLRLALKGYVRNENPAFYYEHYFARNAEWNNSFNKMFSANVGATLSYKKTRLNVSLHSIQNYVYFQEITMPGSSDKIEDRLFGIQACQAGRNIQVASATLYQDFKWGIFHWDNVLTYQISSNKNVLPLPTFNAYSNLYLKFRIAKVLTTHFGADVRYFTSYYAPAYSPIIGQYAVQDRTTRVKIGNYPIVNVYANLHLKRIRFYALASHVNFSQGKGNPFLTPHYPINRLVFRLGVSWNFFN